MAHYAKLGANNKVIAVHVVADTDCQNADGIDCLLYTSPSPRDRQKSRMPSSA